MLANKKGHVKCDDDYQRYLIYECGIPEPRKYHEELIQQGYFIASTTEEILNTFTIPELKEKLELLNQKKTGKKAELVDRVISSTNSEQINSWFIDTLYKLSDKGMDFLSSHDDYVKLHQRQNSWGVSYEEYEQAKAELKHNANQDFKFNDIIWSIVNKNILTSHDYGWHEHRIMYDILKEEGKYEEALIQLLTIWCIDLCGAENIDDINLYKEGIYTKKEAIESFLLPVMPQRTQQTEQYKDIYDEKIADAVYSKTPMPTKLCSKDLFIKIVNSIFDGSYDEEECKNILLKEYSKHLVK